MSDDLFQRAAVLSIRGRLAMAMHAFAGYCTRRGLVHPEIDAFLDHQWRFIDLSGAQAFGEWEANRPQLIDAGLGWEYPPRFEAFLGSKAVAEKEFRDVLSCATEVVYSSLYGAADNLGSLEYLLRLVRTAQRYGADVVPPERFASSRWKDGHGWGDIPSPGELILWRKPDEKAG